MDIPEELLGPEGPDGGGAEDDGRGFGEQYLALAVGTLTAELSYLHRDAAGYLRYRACHEQALGVASGRRVGPPVLSFTAAQLGGPGRVDVQTDLGALSAEEQAAVFAPLAALHKQRLVRSLMKIGGETVAMLNALGVPTGEG